MIGRVFFYVQHLLGIGHLRRAALIARGLDAAGLEVTMASGGEPVSGLAIGGAQLVQLPPAVSADARFSAILAADGKPIDDAWKAERAARLMKSFDAAAPDVLLIEMYPFGRRQFAFELLPLLKAAAARRPRPAVAVSVRDILVAKNRSDRIAETVGILRRYVDRVLVHGDPRVVPFGATFPAAREIADQLRYTGYVTAGSEMTARGADPESPNAEILVSAGGGSVGAPLLAAALAARPLTRLADRRWRLIAGPNMPAAAYGAIAAAAPAGVVVERYRADFQDLLRRCAVSVSQAGYNTVMEVLLARRPAVVLPFAEAGESEQPLRARLLAERGLLTLVEAEALGASSLAAAIDRAAATRPASKLDIDMDGAAHTAALVAELAADARAGRLQPRPGPASEAQ